MQPPPVLGTLLARDFTCPVNRKPLHDAVTLSCGCKVNIAGISNLMDTTIVNGYRMKPGSICPVVPEHSFIKKAVIDPFVRRIVSKIFQGDYPGEGSVFTRVKDMLFESTNPKAFIKSCEIGIHIKICFDKTKTKEFLQFLKDNNLPLEMSAKECESGTYTTKNSHEFHALYEILSKYCEFPEGYQSPVLPYPGEKAVMRHAEGNWTSFTDPSGLCRKMIFKSDTPGSLLYELRLCGFVHGDVRIYVKFDPAKIQGVTQYFSDRGIHLKFQAKWKEQGLYWTTGKKELQAFFNAFSSNNTFPEDGLQQMKEVVSRGRIEPRFAYPGKPAVFKCVKDTWESPTDLRILVFNSQKTDSLIETFMFTRESNGHVRACIDYKLEDKEKILEYFNNLGIKLHSHFSSLTSMWISCAESLELRVLGNALLANNTFPENYLNQVRQLIAKGEATPFKARPNSFGGYPFHEFFGSIAEIMSERGSSSTMPSSTPVNQGAYPGKPSAFVLKGNWEQLIDLMDTQRKVTFIAKEPDALILKFKLLEYKSKNVRLVFKCPSHKIDEIIKFFKHHGINMKWDLERRIMGQYRSSTQHETLSIFNIIAKHNMLAPEDYTKFKEIIEKSPDRNVNDGCQQQ